MARVLNFKTSNKFLLNAISKAPKKKKLKVFKEKFKIYESRMIKNANSFFKTPAQVQAFEKYTLNTIENKIGSHLAKGIYDQKILQRQLNNIISSGRKFQKNRLKREKDAARFSKLPSGTKYGYNLTHAVKTGKHHSECLRRQSEAQGLGVDYDAMIKENDNLPEHNNCECEYYAKRTTYRRFEQGNI